MSHGRGLASGIGGLVSDMIAKHRHPSDSNNSYTGSSQSYAPHAPTAYFIASGNPLGSNAPALTPIVTPDAVPIPPTALLYSLSHPDPTTCERTRFFFECLPDPVGTAYHAMWFARNFLTLPQQQDMATWRHRTIDVLLEDKPGLAWTSGGRITISLQWCNNLLNDCRSGKRTMQDCTFEFKGVILHELVHVVQRDGSGSAPGWLIESIADSVRMAAHLGPPHWRKPGQARRDKGWEDAYDAGANFLMWIMGAVDEDASWGPSSSVAAFASPSAIWSAPAAQATQYPSSWGPPPPVPPRPGNYKSRRPPIPEFVQYLDARLAGERYNDMWWYEMTGASLPQLWSEYMDYYA